MQSRDEIRVGLLGLGNVGAGVVKLLQENAKAISDRLGARLVVSQIAVRDLHKQRLVEVDSAILSTDAAAVVESSNVDIVCELIGGESQARDLVLSACRLAKPIVTANKALLAIHGPELFEAAQAASVDLYYEASVCGGIPIVRALREGLASDRIESIVGIVNGTSNFIATAMADGTRDFSAVLQQAQDAGFAEADPTLDIGGGDAAHKLAILAMVSFGQLVSFDDIHVEGISKISAIDYLQAREFGYVIKPLAIAKRHEDSIELRVHPALVPESWLLADVHGSKNAVYVQSYALGASMYYGAGAGMMPTAMAVVSDLIEVARNLRSGRSGRSAGQTRGPGTALPVRPIYELQSRYYLRFSVEDRPGVLGQLTGVLGKYEVSISELLQSPQACDTEPAQVIALTHMAQEGKIQAALQEIVSLGITQDQPTLLRIANDS